MTNRQKLILERIVELYIESGEPVGSKTLIAKYNMSISSATIRNEMALLENENFLEKSHTSSGRIPSKKGFNFFAKETKGAKDVGLARKLEDIFSKRRASIDFTLDEAAKAITEIAGLTLVTSNSQTDELMKSIQLTPINDKMATVVIVTSSGRVESKIIDLNEYVNINDVRIAVRLFKERLIDTKLNDLSLKVEALAPILAKAIKNYEEIIKAFVGRIFDFNQKIKNKVYGSKELIKSDISRDELIKIIDMVQNKSIWESIEGKIDDEETLKIDVRENASIISKRINVNSNSTDISIVGSNRMNYAEAKTVIKLLENFLEKK